MRNGACIGENNSARRDLAFHARANIHKEHSNRTEGRCAANVFARFRYPEPLIILRLMFRVAKTLQNTLEKAAFSRMMDKSRFKPTPEYSDKKFSNFEISSGCLANFQSVWGHPAFQGGPAAARDVVAAIGRSSLK